jgi:hypothetical protein
LVIALSFITDYLNLLLFAVTLVIGFFVTRKNRPINANTLLGLIWESVAFSLTLTYIIGTSDYVFFKSSHFNFGRNDVSVIIIPGIICLLVLAVGAFYKFVSKFNRKNNDGGGD